MSESTPAVETSEDAKPRKGGRRKYTITDAARAHERALSELDKVTRGNKKVEKAEERLVAAKAKYDEAVAEAGDKTEAIATAQAEVDRTKEALDALVLGSAEADADV